jgi:hypothetical protein
MAFARHMEKYEIYKKDIMVCGERGRYYTKKKYENPPTDA